MVSELPVSKSQWLESEALHPDLSHFGASQEAQW